MLKKLLLTLVLATTAGTALASTEMTADEYMENVNNAAWLDSCRFLAEERKDTQRAEFAKQGVIYMIHKNPIDARESFVERFTTKAKDRLAEVSVRGNEEAAYTACKVVLDQTAYELAIKQTIEDADAMHKAHSQ
ncbi:hypothetical protein JCM19236_5654 [Vibrio sp. JCM 19236]|nr:hypothetical protein JCM19236_5654 [Vibrio sp. JCM 19236]